MDVSRCQRGEDECLDGAYVQEIAASVLLACEETQAHDGQRDYERHQEAKHLRRRKHVRIKL